MKSIAGNLRTLSLLGCLSAVVVVAGQSQAVEHLGAVPASQLVGGLGFNLDPAEDWQFAAAAAAGATSVRFQCGWEGVETQTPAPDNRHASPQYGLPARCSAALASAKRYGLRPTVLAAYGPPYHELLRFRIPNGAAAGSRTIDIELASGPAGITVQNITPFETTVIAADRSYLTRIHGYAGGLVSAISASDATHATVSLASALSRDLPASTSTTYVVNQYLYPPPANFLPTEPSNLAYAAYARFLAESINAAGISGEVEIWNEPPWNDDPWDQRSRYYDDLTGAEPGPDWARLANFGFAAILQQDEYAVPNVNYVWGGTHQTGATTLFDWMQTSTGVPFRQPAAIITAEAWHPYGNTPEDGLWSEPCMRSAVAADASNPYPGFFGCNLFGLAGGNASIAEWYSLRQQMIDPGWGVRRQITETGISAAYADPSHRTRHVLRQFLGYQAAGVTPIQFYKLYDGNPANFGFLTGDADGYAPLPHLSALTDLLNALRDIGGPPGAPPSTTPQPTVVSYGGQLPLTIVALVGTRQGYRANSMLFTLWQRSSGANWGTSPSPAAAAVTLQLPAGASARRIVNLATQEAVAVTVSGQNVTFAVSDDPIGLLIDPALAGGLLAPTGLRLIDRDSP